MWDVLQHNYLYRKVESKPLLIFDYFLIYPLACLFTGKDSRLCWNVISRQFTWWSFEYVRLMQYSQLESLFNKVYGVSKNICERLLLYVFICLSMKKPTQPLNICVFFPKSEDMCWLFKTEAAACKCSWK